MTTGAEQPCLSVVMPCFNESSTIATIADRVLASPYVSELIVVDDCSWDDTPAIVAAIDDPRVRLIQQPKNMGKGAALRAGFAEARSDYIVVQDADLEYNPDDFGALLAPLLDGRADVVFGSRFLSGHPHRVLYFWHSVGNRLLTLLSNMFTNINLTDMETCYKAFRREVLTSFTLEEDRFGIEPEITAKVARGGWRIYEVSISYDGRSYAEGKKIGWRDGFRALYCILRYSSIGERVHGSSNAAPVGFDEADLELSDTLDSLDDARNYLSWIIDSLAPYLRGRVLEVGAGHGTMTERLAEFGQVTALEPSPRAAGILRERFAGDPRVFVLESGASEAYGLGPFDAIVLINVLEHIEHDRDAIEQLAKSLAPGGHILVFSPAFQILYSDFDRRIGHYRRYRLAELEAIMESSGLEIAESRYMNSVGAFGWLVFARFLGQVPTQSWSAQAFDRLAVPVVRRLERRPPRFGQSALVIGRSERGDRCGHQ